MTKEGKKRMKAAAAAALAGLSVPLLFLFWLWPEDRLLSPHEPEVPAAQPEHARPERAHSVPLALGAPEIELPKTVPVVGSGAGFTTDAGFGNLITLDVADEQPSVQSWSDHGFGYPANRKAGSAGHGGRAFSAAAGGSHRHAARLGPTHLAALGPSGSGGRAAPGGGVPSSFPKSPVKNDAVDEPEEDLLRQAADGPAVPGSTVGDEGSGSDAGGGDDSGDGGSTGGGTVGGGTADGGTADGGTADGGTGGGGTGGGDPQQTASGGDGGSGGDQGGGKQAGGPAGGGSSPVDSFATLQLTVDQEALRDVPDTVPGVPEPGAMLLALTALAGLGVGRRRKR